MLTIKAQISLAEVAGALDRARRQVPYAASRAINDVAKDVQGVLREELPRAFDRPTPYIRNSIKVSKWANKQDVSAIIEPQYMGGKGTDPQNILRAEVFGGARKFKRSEVLLQRRGILPAGYITVPGKACPLDQYGNVPGPFLVRLLAYLQAFGEVGFRANMNAKGKRRLARKVRLPSGFLATDGVEYFVSHGRLRGGKGSWLPPGIWSRSGIHGSNVQPILMFVRAGSYRPRYDFMGLADRTVRLMFPDRFDARFAMAMETAR